jgi:hypothetical protein
MKKAKLFALLVLILGAVSVNRSHAQVDVTLNPIGLLFGDINAGIDFALGENISLEAVVGYGGASSNTFNLKYNNLPVTGVFKYYFGPKLGADRFYADAFVRFVTRSATAEEGSSYAGYTQTRLGGGIGVGYKAVSQKGLVFDIGLGFGRTVVNNLEYKDSNGIQETVDWPGIMIIAKLGLGYRFGGRK